MSDVVVVFGGIVVVVVKMVGLKSDRLDAKEPLHCFVNG